MFKKVMTLALVCLMMMTMLASCGKGKLIGEWEIEESGISMTFLKLEKGGEGELLGVDIEWKTKGSKLILKSEEGEESFKYSIKGDVLTLEKDGEEVELNKK